mmetsp:Transcript_11508/g.38436  ORF Transcript_11508/g.38436 Transcript_11508/m.38436 type:complete len:272 (-) Transcript_11508:662-1477(-)
MYSRGKTVQAAAVEFGGRGRVLAKGPSRAVQGPDPPLRGRRTDARRALALQSDGAALCDGHDRGRLCFAFTRPTLRDASAAHAAVRHCRSPRRARGLRGDAVPVRSLGGLAPLDFVPAPDSHLCGRLRGRLARCDARRDQGQFLGHQRRLRRLQDRRRRPRREFDVFGSGEFRARFGFCVPGLARRLLRRARHFTRRPRRTLARLLRVADVAPIAARSARGRGPCIRVRAARCRKVAAPHEIIVLAGIRRVAASRRQQLSLGAQVSIARGL